MTDLWIALIVALFVVYVGATAWQARRALEATDPKDRLAEARRLLIIVSVGVPLVVVLILVAL